MNKLLLNEIIAELYINELQDQAQELLIALGVAEYDTPGRKTLEELLRLYRENGLERAITYFIPHRKEISIALQDKTLSKFRNWFTKFTQLVNNWILVSPQLEKLGKTLLPEKSDWPAIPKVVY